MKKEVEYKVKFRLKKGFLVYIDGIPHEYLGNGMVGTNTDYEDKIALHDSWAPTD